MKEIVSGVHAFDAMAILLACVCHNILAMILLQKSYWTTRSGNDYSQTVVKLAYVGSGILKFIVPLEEKQDPQQQGYLDALEQVNDEAVADTSEQVNDEDSVHDDLSGTGLLLTDENQPAADSESAHGEYDVDVFGSEDSGTESTMDPNDSCAHDFSNDLFDPIDEQANSDVQNGQDNLDSMQQDNSLEQNNIPVKMTVSNV